MMRKTLAAALLLSLACLSARAADAPASQPAFRVAAKVPLGNPRGVTVDTAGNLYVVDIEGPKIYKITLAGAATAVKIDGIASPLGISVSPDGTLAVSDTDAGAAYRIAPDGTLNSIGSTTGPAALSAPTAIAIDAKNNVYITNNSNSTILKISASGEASILAGKAGESGNVDGKGDTARFAMPRGIAVDDKRTVYVADEGNSNVRKITPEGVVTTLLGPKEGVAIEPAAQLAGPRALAVDKDGNVYVADTDNNCIRKITPDGKMTTLAGKPGESGNAEGKGGAARFAGPRGIAVDNAGNVYVADADNAAIREISPAGEVTTVAAP